MNAAGVRTVAVLGAGTMGNGIAHVFARSGYKVILRDIDQSFLDRAIGAVSRSRFLRMVSRPRSRKRCSTSHSTT